MRILITGADGQIGWELCRALHPFHQVIASTRPQCDLTDPDSIRNFIREIQPQLLINAAGYTAVDLAERDAGLALAINGIAVGVIGEECHRLGASVIHYSTDYVFDGSAEHPYLPDSETNPISAYGRSKLAGEVALRNSSVAHLILRASWVYGARGNNFLMTMLRLADDRPELRIVNDQTGSPTWARDIARATVEIIQRSLESSQENFRFLGGNAIHHLASSGRTSWFQFAQSIFDLAKHVPTPKLIPISAAQYAAPARRPAFSVLDCSTTERTFGVRLPAWRQSLEAVMQEIEPRSADHHAD